MGSTPTCPTKSALASPGVHHRWDFLLELLQETLLHLIQGQSQLNGASHLRSAWFFLTRNYLRQGLYVKGLACEKKDEHDASSPKTACITGVQDGERKFANHIEGGKQDACLGQTYRPTQPTAGVI